MSRATTRASSWQRMGSSWARVTGTKADAGSVGRRKRRVVGGQEGSIAAGRVRIPASRSSFTKRSCRVRLTRSLRPRACGDWPRMCSMPSACRAGPTASGGSGPGHCQRSGYGPPSGRGRWRGRRAAHGGRTRSTATVMIAGVLSPPSTSCAYRICFVASSTTTRLAGCARCPGGGAASGAGCHRGAATPRNRDGARAGADGGPGPGPCGTRPAAWRAVLTSV